MNSIYGHYECDAMEYEYDATWRGSRAGLTWSANVRTEGQAPAYRTGRLDSADAAAGESAVHEAIERAIDDLVCAWSRVTTVGSGTLTRRRDRRTVAGLPWHTKIKFRISANGQRLQSAANGSRVSSSSWSWWDASSCRLLQGTTADDDPGIIHTATTDRFCTAVQFLRRPLIYGCHTGGGV